MTEQVHELLARVRRRTPKLVDQMALDEIENALVVSEKLAAEGLLCDNCSDRLTHKVSADGGISVKACLACGDDVIRETFISIAGKTNDPEILRLIARGINRL